MSTNDPHVKWFEDWKNARTEWRKLISVESDDTPKSEKLWDESIRLGALISKTPTKTLQGVIAQLKWMQADDNAHYAEKEHGRAADHAIKALEGLCP